MQLNNDHIYQLKQTPAFGHFFRKQNTSMYLTELFFFSLSPLLLRLLFATQLYFSSCAHLKNTNLPFFLNRYSVFEEIVSRRRHCLF